MACPVFKRHPLAAIGSGRRAGESQDQKNTEREPLDMRAVVMLVIVSVLAAPAAAQTVADSFDALQAILKPGQMLVVIDHTRRETTGTITQDGNRSTGLRVVLNPSARRLATPRLWYATRTDVRVQTSGFRFSARDFFAARSSRRLSSAA